MNTFISRITDTKTCLCTREQWEALTKASSTKQNINMFRTTGDIKWKQMLPAVNFQGYDPAVLTGNQGSRLQINLKPTGLFMLDVDHIEQPKQLWHTFKEVLKKAKIPLEKEVALVHITPSGQGLRIVMKGREGSTIKDDQEWLANLLGVKHDVCTKDLSRWSYVPREEDVLYINAEVLFMTPPVLPTEGGGNPHEEEMNPYEKAYLERMETTPHSVVRERKEQGAESDHEDDNDAMGRRFQAGFPSTYHGIPYKKIVETLVQYHGGTPEVGDRHSMIITLANDLLHITDSNADWLMQIVPNFDKPDYEKRSAVTWAVQHNALRKTKALTAVLDWLQNGTPLGSSPLLVEGQGEVEESEEAEERKRKEAEAKMPQMPEKLPQLVTLLTSNVMPFQKPAVASMVFPALATHVGQATFKSIENNQYELSLMGVLVGKQSVGKGCIDNPIKEIIWDILQQDEQAREEERAWAESQQNKKANEKGAERPKKPIRILNSDVTPAALLQRLYAAEHYGYCKDLRVFTKVEEIEELYSMAPVSGRSRISQLIKKTWDVGRIGSERFSSNSANFTTALRWNWVAACTPDKAKMFFQKALTDGTLSRVDFSTIIAPDEKFKFLYGDYDEAFADALEPYINNLKAFRCEDDKRGRRIPFSLPELDALEEKADEYIEQKAGTMVDDTWKNYAWRTKLVAMKKIMILYIANGGKWEEEFENFFFWCFDYGMWVKMNLFYKQAREAFGGESIISDGSADSPLEHVGYEFTREEINAAVKACGHNSKPSTFIYKKKMNGYIEEIEPGKKYRKLPKAFMRK